VSTISFARGVPAPECLPIEDLADCARTAIERDGAAALLYGHTLGYQPLREWLGERHDVEPARVIVTNGSLQAFHFVLSALAGAGRVIVERPTYDRPRRILSSFDEVAVDDEGLDLGELERVLAAGGPPAFLYTIPTFQNPTGVTLSEERRRQLAELAADRNLRILEDDPYGLVRFEGEPLPSLFELEGGRNVIYSSSFSKTIAPGIRVGYVVVVSHRLVMVQTETTKVRFWRNQPTVVASSSRVHDKLATATETHDAITCTWTARDGGGAYCGKADRHGYVVGVTQRRVWVADEGDNNKRP